MVKSEKIDTYDRGKGGGLDVGLIVWARCGCAITEGVINKSEHESEQGSYSARCLSKSTKGSSRLRRLTSMSRAVIGWRFHEDWI